MRSIMLHVHEDDGMEARLQVALDIARAFDAHITCLQPVSFDFAVPGDLYGTMIAELIPVMQEAADKLRERTCARLANEDVVSDWRQEEGPARPLLQRAEGLTDLVIVGTRDPASSGKGPSGLTGYMAIHGRSPLLVVPKKTRSFDTSGAAVIGWNGSLEAAHALRGAVPLLRKAASVTLFAVVASAKSLLARHSDERTKNTVLEALDRVAFEGDGLTTALLAGGDGPSTQESEAAAAISDLSSVIRTLVGPDVRVDLELESGPARVRMAPAALQAIMLELAANARSAGARHLRVRAGRRGAEFWLVVSDDGRGFGSLVRQELAHCSGTHGTGLARIAAANRPDARSDR